MLPVAANADTKYTLEKKGVSRKIVGIAFL